MDITKLPRDQQACKAAIQVTKDNTWVAKSDIRIYIPTRWQERGLATVGDEIRVTSVYLMTVDNRSYGVSKICARMQLTPTSMTIIKMDKDEFFEFYFERGATITPNNKLVKDSGLVYRLYDEVVAKGHIPWYFGYEDLGKLFITAAKHAGVRLAANNVPLEMITASITRDPRDRTVYYRHIIKTAADIDRRPPTFIAFRSIIYGATNTTAKLMGSYFDDGLLSALVNPSEKAEDVESFLRQ